MRLICPNCVAQYEVDEDVIPSEGRDVQCANCGHNWFQDALQMLSSEAEIPSGSGDPEGDVPAALFNDLEGKLDTSFASTRTQIAPDPNDMEPENPRDDFQIEQEPDAPSSRLGRDALDILHAEAEYSSGEKPPAAEDQEPEAPQSTPENVPQEPTVETPDSPVDESVAEVKEPQEAEEPAQQPPEPNEQDDLDEIRRRIMDLELQESGPEQPVPDPAPTADQADDIVTPDLSAQETPAPRSDNPFSRPSTGTARRLATKPPDPVKPLYEENIPFEEDTASTPDQGHATEKHAAEQMEAEVVSKRPMRQSAPRPFPDVDDNDTLYDTIDEPGKNRSDIFPDVDELSSEIASEADYNVVDHQPATITENTKSSFFKGFRYAIYLCVIISALYLSKPVIVEYIPQAEGVLTTLTEIVDKAASLISPLINPLIEKIKALIS